MLCLGGSEYAGIDDDLSQVDKLIANNPFPKLKKLGLCNATPMDQIVDILESSEMLKQLESLDLSMGQLGDAGGKKLASA